LLVGSPAIFEAEWGSVTNQKHRRRNNSICFPSTGIDLINESAIFLRATGELFPSREKPARGSESRAGRRDRIDNDRGFLALKFIDRANPAARYAVLQLENLRVIRRNDKNISELDRRLIGFAIDPCRL
jgi:hypothetical protein